MRRCPEEDDPEHHERGPAEVARGARVADERRHGARGAADHDVLRRRPLQPARVDEDVEEIAAEREQRGGEVHQRVEQNERERRERDPELERELGGDPSRGDRALGGSLAHQLVDVAVEVVVERRRAAAGERETHHRHCEHAPRGHARGADERGRAAGQEQQRHHARLRQRDVVVHVAARRSPVPPGLGAEERRRAERERRRRQVDGGPGQQRGEPEQDEGRERGRQQRARRDPREYDEPSDRRQRERREQLVRGAPVGHARDDGEAGAEHRGDGEQPRPGADRRLGGQRSASWPSRDATSAGRPAGFR